MSGLAGGDAAWPRVPRGAAAHTPLLALWLVFRPEPSHPSQGPCSPCHRAYPRGCAHSPPRPVAPQRSHPLWKPYELEVGTRPKSEDCQGAQQNPSPQPSAGAPSPGREAADGRGAGQRCPLRAPRLAPRVGGRPLGVGDPGSAPGLLAAQLQGGPKPALGGPWEGLWHATKSYQKLCCGGLHPTDGRPRHERRREVTRPRPRPFHPCAPTHCSCLCCSFTGLDAASQCTARAPHLSTMRHRPHRDAPGPGRECHARPRGSTAVCASCETALGKLTHQSMHVPEQQLCALNNRPWEWPRPLRATTVPCQAEASLTGAQPQPPRPRVCHPAVPGTVAGALLQPHCGTSHAPTQVPALGRQGRLGDQQSRRDSGRLRDVRGLPQGHTDGGVEPGCQPCPV